MSVMSSAVSTPFVASFSWADLCQATAGVVVQTPDDTSGPSYVPSTDTRTITTGALYVPIVGERFDGHQFIQQAIMAGANAVLVQADRRDLLPELPPSVGVIQVSNTTQAYLALGRYHRRRCQAVIIGLTGSSGKTTTKQMLYQALSPYLNTQCTQKNFNNEMGVAQTLLSLNPQTDVLIVEMGMRGLHEIELLSRYAEPNISVVVNIGPAHIGRLGSLQNIAIAKSEVVIGLIAPSQAQKNRYLNLTPQCIFDGDSPFIQQALEERQQAMPFALCPVYLNEIKALTVSQGKTTFNLGGVNFQLSQPGEHLAKNTQLIVQVAQGLGITATQVANALKQPLPNEGRWAELNYIWQVSGQSVAVRVINDAYNANPQSMAASLHTLSKQIEQSGCPVYPVIVMGGMKELGEYGEAYHQQTAETLNDLSPLHAGEVLLVGEETQLIQPMCHKTFNGRVECWPSAQAPEPSLWQQWLQQAMGRWQCQVNIPLDTQGSPQLLVWLKGSRSYQLEQFIAALDAHLDWTRVEQDTV